MFNIDFYRENMKKNIMSETRRPRTLIFDMKHHLVDLYQVCSNYSTWAKNCPAREVTCSTFAYIRKKVKKSSCLKPQGLEP